MKSLRKSYNFETNSNFGKSESVKTFILSFAEACNERQEDGNLEIIRCKHRWFEIGLVISATRREETGGLKKSKKLKIEKNDLNNLRF
ncbi:hypothetical protein DRO97_05710 [Archaeoglobales archaeon]|nr:MAG: hypothetical protein DRO97_05710 [Archaeoglobales archaeon]